MMITLEFENGHKFVMQDLPCDEQSFMVDKYLYWPKTNQVFFSGLTFWRLVGKQWTKVWNLEENEDEILGQRIVIES